MNVIERYYRARVLLDRREALRAAVRRDWRELFIFRPRYVTGTGQVLWGVHEPSVCEGLPCVIHNPSSHRMSDFPTHWRGDRGIMERLCPHGIGHPDPDDQAFLERMGMGDGVHGCDGCCVEPRDFVKWSGI